MTEPAHAILAPSSAHIWVKCAASVGMQQRYPQVDDSDDARNGTAAHWYVTETLQGRDPGPVAPNGVPISAEMVDCAQGILIDVRDTMAAHPGALLRVEHRVAMGVVHPDNWGTPDVAIYDPARNFLAIWDYKFGHRYVSPEANLQLIEYAIGVLCAMAVPSREWPGWTVSLNIAQPRNYHASGPIREWQTNGGRLLDEYVPILYAAAKAAVDLPDPPAQTGEHCRDCSARHVCPALQAAAALAVDIAGQVEPLELTPHALGLELRYIQDAETRLAARKSGLEEMALAIIRGGRGVPFFTTEYTTGRERWTVPTAEVLALADLMGVDGLAKPPEPVTPNQARELFKKSGIDGAVISAYAERPRGALRLARVADTAAKLAFE